MKSKIQIILSMLFLLIAATAFAQVPQKFNYQGIARDAKGNPLANQHMNLKLSVLATADATSSEYEETQSVTTNEFGLYALQIGNGTPVTGNMKSVKWETGNKYIKVAIDPAGGNNYADAGTSQLLSVPYAIYADKAGSMKGDSHGDTRTGSVSSDAAHVVGDVNYVTKFTALNTIGKSSIFDNSTVVGIGTAPFSPATAVHIKKTTATYLTVQADANNSTAAIRLQDNNGTGGELGLSKFGTATTGNFMGIPRARMGVLNCLTGPFVVNAGGYMFFGQTVGVNAINRLMIDSATGYVGVGTSIAGLPTQRLDVNGQIRMRGGAPGAGKLMISAADGTASWSDPSSAGLISGSGTIDYVPKFNPDGTTLGNSRLLDNSTGLMYNKSIQDPSINGATGSTDFTFKGFLNAVVINKNAAAENQFIMTNPNSQLLLMGDSMKMATAIYDSVGSVLNYNANNTMHFGGLSKGLNINNANGKMANGSLISQVGSAHLTINSSYDTAALFTSNSANYLGSGILRVDYTGPTGATNDNKGIYSRSQVSPNYGYGIYGVGGYYGVFGSTNLDGTAGVGGSGDGSSIGVYGSSSSGSGVYGVSSTGSAVSGLSFGDGSEGLTGYSYGANGYGVHAYGDSIGTSGGGRIIGARNKADNNAGPYQHSYGTYSTATNTVGRSYGIYAGAVGGNPSYNSYGIYAEASGSGAYLYAGVFAGNLYATTGTFGTKPFTIDHPLDPANKILRHSSIESPDMMNLYNGNIVTDAKGYATVTLPDYFDALNENFKYQLTVLDNSDDFVLAKISKEISNNTFEIRSSKPNVKISWLVTGVRHDAVAKKFPIIVEEYKVGENVGHYFEPEAYGQPKTLRIGYMAPPTAEAASADRFPLKTQYEQILKTEAAHKLNNDAALKNWKQQEIPKIKHGTGGNLSK